MAFRFFQVINACYHSLGSSYLGQGTEILISLMGPLSLGFYTLLDNSDYATAAGPWGLPAEPAPSYLSFSCALCVSAPSASKINNTGTAMISKTNSTWGYRILDFEGNTSTRPVKWWHQEKLGKPESDRTIKKRLHVISTTTLTNPHPGFFFPAPQMY